MDESWKNVHIILQKPKSYPPHQIECGKDEGYQNQQSTQQTLIETMPVMQGIKYQEVPKRAISGQKKCVSCSRKVKQEIKEI